MGETQGALPLDPTRGFASGLHKGERNGTKSPPLTLSRDSVGDTFMQCPRVYPMNLRFKPTNMKP